MQQRQTARDNYILAEVQTATPQKLQLLLVEAAIKNIHRTKHAWSEKKFDVGLDYLTKAQDIVAEILSSLDVESNPAIAKQLASIYLFVFRRLAESGMSNDEEKINDALRVLNSERETWRLVCEKFGSTLAGGNEGANAAVQATNLSAEYTPSGNGSASLDLSSAQQPSGKAQVLVPPNGTPSPVGPATFSRPTGSFGTGVRPLGASPIQTSSSLASPKPQQPATGIQTFASNQPGQNQPNSPNSVIEQAKKLNPQPGQQPQSPSTPVAPSLGTGNNWEV